MNKKITILMVLSLVFLIIFGAAYTYGLFQSSISDDVEVDVADWVIKINGTNVTNGYTEEFTITNITYNNGNYVRDGKLAPGTTGYFTVAIDPTDTEVSVKYEILIDPESFNNDNISITGVTRVSGSTTFQKINDNKYVGVIPLSNQQVTTLRVNFEWENDEANNEQDSLIGTRENPDLEIPITVNLVQYLGEALS